MSTQRPSKRPVRAPLARYANYYEVGHNAYEFLIDFGQFQPEAAEVVLHTRIALGPIHAKLLSRMLEKAIQKYETDNSPIPEPEDARDPLEVVLRSLPDFDRRAVDARRETTARLSGAKSHRPPKKR